LTLFVCEEVDRPAVEDMIDSVLFEVEVVDDVRMLLIEEKHERRESPRKRTTGGKKYWSRSRVVTEERPKRKQSQGAKMPS
jgi:hypothetical protein